jgi:ribosome-binding factor A
VPTGRAGGLRDDHVLSQLVLCREALSHQLMDILNLRVERADTMTTKRTLRVGELIKREIADILCREVKNPKVGFVTVRSVDVTRDLRTAVVRVSVMGDDERREEAIRSLNSATGFIQKELSARVRLRYMPKLQFRLDTSIDHSMHIAELLEEIKETEARQHRQESQKPQDENTGDNQFE